MKEIIKFTTTSVKVGYSLISFTGCQCCSNNANKPPKKYLLKGYCSAMNEKMPRWRQSAGWLPESVISGFLRFVSNKLNEIHVLQYDADDVLTVLLTLRPKRETRERPAATAPSSHETLKTHKIFPNDFQPFLFRTQSKFCGKTQFLMHIYCPYALSSRKAAVVQWQIFPLLLAIVLTFILMF